MKRAPKPFAILLGGKHPKALLELHDVRFTMARDYKEAFLNVAGQWFGKKSSVHMDAWLDLSLVDGHRFVPGTKKNGKVLYFVNIGGYLKDHFGEEHRYRFLVGEHADEVKKRAQEAFGRDFLLPHKDNFSAVDLLIPVEEIGGRSLRWEPAPGENPNVASNGYWPLRQFVK
jgi:hypothetical protein